ncbi:MAG: ATPase inhibitor subunit zeta, partial [Mangrovicoccus sp.]
ARRDHLLGLWAAEKLGKTGTDAEAYAQALVKEDFADPRHETIASHISKDLGDLANEDDVKAKMAEFLSAAKEQLAEEA